MPLKYWLQRFPRLVHRKKQRGNDVAEHSPSVSGNDCDRDLPQACDALSVVASTISAKDNSAQNELATDVWQATDSISASDTAVVGSTSTENENFPIAAKTTTSG